MVPPGTPKRRKEDQNNMELKKLLLAGAVSLAISLLGSMAGGAWGASHQLTRMQKDIESLRETDQKVTSQLAQLDSRKLDIRQHDELVARLVALESQNAEDHRRIFDLLTKLASQR